MTDINDVYINALLADATYALDDTTGNGLTDTDLEDKLNVDGRMTPALAKYIGDNFEVVTHVESSDVFDSGFDATVWKDKRTDEIYISTQGTTGLADFHADIDLTLSGVAQDQIEDMVNWWLRNTTPIIELGVRHVLS